MDCLEAEKCEKKTTGRKDPAVDLKNLAKQIVDRIRAIQVSGNHQKQQAVSLC